jgi:hypothetical protein
MLVSDVFWFGFLIGALALIVTGVTVLVRRIRGTRSAPAQR